MNKKSLRKKNMNDEAVKNFGDKFFVERRKEQRRSFHLIKFEVI